MAKLRSKDEIILTLKETITDSDRKVTQGMYNCSMILVKNKGEGASYVGWSRNEYGVLTRIEGEPRGEGASSSLACKNVTVEVEMADRLGLNIVKEDKPFF